jgi:hypothetical protein
MIRSVVLPLSAAVILSTCTGCMSRVLKEGVGTVRGARGAFVQAADTQSLADYRGLDVQTFTISNSIPSATRMPALIEKAITTMARKQGLVDAEGPRLRLAGAIVHYETADTVGTLIGPLEEVIVHALLYDAATGARVGEANLVGRAESTTASGDANLAAGVAKALQDWLAKRGMPLRD